METLSQLHAKWNSFRATSHGEQFNQTKLNSRSSPLWRHEPLQKTEEQWLSLKWLSPKIVLNLKGTFINNVLKFTGGSNQSHGITDSLVQQTKSPSHNAPALPHQTHLPRQLLDALLWRRRTRRATILSVTILSPAFQL